ncbi:MAG: pyridoxal phosphate-dependent aminotransferase [Firmicutes bacterium]|nr:pyridoxal phosphate-dependent aminotransferase [Bacillota bacterium]
MYDFKNVVDRRGQGQTKWMAMKELKPNVAPDVMPFSVADMEFKNAPEIINGLKEYLDKTILGYTIRNEGFNKAIKSWYKRRHDYDIDTDKIVNFPGVVSGLYLGIEMFTEPGEGVIVMPPVYYPFFGVISAQGRNIVECPLIDNDGHYEIDFEKFEQLASKKENTMTIVCNPHNPVGRVWTKDELKRIGEIANKYNLFILDDEIHNDLIMPGYKHTMMANVLEDKSKFITFTSASKTFNMAGMTLCSAIIEDDDLYEKFANRTMETARTTCTSLGYKAAEIAYNECEAWLDECLEHIYENHKFVLDYFSKNHPGFKAYKLEGTYLQWIDFNSLGLSIEELEKRNIENDVFLDEGYIFGTGGHGFERINLAAPKSKIEELLKRISKVIGE